MAKSKKPQSESSSRSHGASLRKLSSRCKRGCGDMHHEALPVKGSKKREWDNAVCSVCLEFPHNAVLLLCSSYDKGCRPYMCATSNRYSNCLDQYSKAYAKETSNIHTPPWQGTVASTHLSEGSVTPNTKSGTSELLCPLCRGQVKGWTVVEPARRYLNTKKRACVQDKCSFVGTYKAIRKHVKSEHPKACPRDVDPSHVEKWKKLERERDVRDVISTITANTPGAIVLGDYVLEGNYGFSGDSSEDDDGFEDEFFSFPARGEDWNDTRFPLWGDLLRAPNSGRNISRIAPPHARFLFSRQGRRSRERRQHGF